MSEANGERVEDEILAEGGRAMAVQTDVTAEASVNAVLQRAADAYGRIDSLSSNTALLRPGTINDHTGTMLFLCSDEAGFIIQSDGGRTFLRKRKVLAGAWRRR